MGNRYSFELNQIIHESSRSETITSRDSKQVVTTPELCSTTMVNPELCSTTMVNPELCSTTMVNPELCSTTMVNPELCSTTMVNPELCSTTMVNPDIADHHLTKIIKSESEVKHTPIKKATNKNTSKICSNGTNSLDPEERLKIIYEQNTKCMIRISNLMFGYPRAKHTLLCNSKMIKYKEQELSQYDKLDLFELMNLSTGLGYPMVTINYSYNKIYRVEEYFTHLAKSQNFAEEYINVYHATLNICYYKFTNLESYGCEKTVMNIKIEDLQLEILNLLEFYISIPRSVVMIIYDFVIGCIVKHYPKYSLRNIGIDYQNYRSDEDFRRLIISSDFCNDYYYHEIY